MYHDHILFLPRLLPDPATSIATQLHVLSLKKKKQKEKVKNEIKTNKPKITKKRERKKEQEKQTRQTVHKEIQSVFCVGHSS